MPDSTPTFWDDLLEYIDERRVIPIVGSELLRDTPQSTPLHADLARQLARRLKIDASDNPDDGALNYVIGRHMQSGGRREDVYPRLRAIMKEAAPPVPEPLRQLAGILHFNLFVSTTFDSLLEQAINDVRFGGAAMTQSIVYRPADVRDIPCVTEKLTVPTVFHLLGRLSAAPDYAVTDDDTLEFLNALQSENGRPELLFDELKNKHVLLIGCGFPDWLARFFIRLIKGGRLSVQRNSQEIIADQIARKDANLVLFLKHFSYRTDVFAEGNAVEFVRELSRQYAARQLANPPVDVPPGFVRGDDEEMASGAVFLSYSSQDLPNVQRLRDQLSAAGIEVWFDRRSLEGGDLYDAKIRDNIKNCSVFLPVISANTQAREVGYFRKEWNLAAARAHEFYHKTPFIFPVTIDGASRSTALVPEEFLQAQWTSLPGGQPTPEFISLLTRRVRDYHKGRGGTP